MKCSLCEVVKKYKKSILFLPPAKNIYLIKSLIILIMNIIQYPNEKFCCHADHSRSNVSPNIFRDKDDALSRALSNPTDKETASIYVWMHYVFNPYFRRANPGMKEKSPVLDSHTAITIVAPRVIPSGTFARQILDWIVQKALKEMNYILKQNKKNGNKKDIPAIWIAIPADPIDAFEEITDNKYGRGNRIGAQVKEFVKQFVYITEVSYGVKLKDGSSTVRRNMRFISEAYGWLADYKECDGPYRTTDSGRPSLELIQERESRDNCILISPEYVKRVLMKPGKGKGTDIGSHHSFFSVSKDVLRRLKTNLLQDFYKPLCWCCLYAYKHGDGRVLMPWSFAYDGLYDDTTGGDQILQKGRKAHIKKALIECTSVHNEYFADAPPITINFTRRGIEVFCSKWPAGVG